LYQLPPVVKDHEWGVLSRFYKSMHFFEAKALQNSGMIYLELDKIFRQQDDIFSRILNNLRDNRATTEDVQVLNRYYKSLDQIRDLPPTITLTTHNYKADELNLRELRSLDSPSVWYEAEIEREFPENLYPIPKSIELKVGARIMFIKNDSSGNASYFNGKLATVTNLSEEITVELDDSHVEYVLRKEVWENKKYQIDPDTKELEEEVIGTFSQYPIKLAWAVTVHKSQGLTFDRAIIDVGQAFAPGQVYVALSRLRSLEGLILRTRVQSDVIYSDPKVVDFTQGAGLQNDLVELLSKNQTHYLSRLIQETFEFESLLKSLVQFDKDQQSNLEFEEEDLRKELPAIYDSLQSESDNTRKFRTQLQLLLHNNEREKLHQRIEKGTGYYLQFLQGILEKLLLHQVKVESFSRIKTYQNGLEELELELLRKYLGIARSGRLILSIGRGEITGKMEDLEREIASTRRSILEKIRETLPAKSQNSTKTGRKKTGAKSKKAPGEKKESSNSI